MNMVFAVKIGHELHAGVIVVDGLAHPGHNDSLVAFCLPGHVNSWGIMFVGIVRNTFGLGGCNLTRLGEPLILCDKVVFSDTIILLLVSENQQVVIKDDLRVDIVDSFEFPGNQSSFYTQSNS